MSSIAPLHPRPADATLTVARAAQVLGVHPNTVRAWSDAGRLRYYRINPRGDRRYRLGDLQRFLTNAASGPPLDELGHGGGRLRRGRHGEGRVGVPSLEAEVILRMAEVVPRSRPRRLEVEPAVGAVRLAVAEAHGGATIPTYV